MATPLNPLPSAFDAHHPPATAIIDKCVHCGFCLPVCPTYVLWGQEMDSPRGRIYLMKLAAEGAAQMTPKWVSHFDTCLGCMACMTACPSGVDYAKLIEATRGQIERNFPRATSERRHRHFLFDVHASGPLAPFARAASRVSKIWIASFRSGLGIAQTTSEEMADHGSAASQAHSARRSSGSYSGSWREAPARRLAPRLRPARVFLTGECRHGARSCCRRM